MLQVLPDSDIPKTWLSFDKNFLPPNFPSDCFFGQYTGRVFESKPYNPQFETAEYPSTATKNNDQFRVRGWMKPHEYQSTNSGLSSKRPMVQRQAWRENLGYWREPFTPLGSQPQRLQPFELQHRPMPQARYLPAERGRTLSLPGSDGRYMDSNAKCLGSSQSFNGKDIKAEEPSPNIFHPIPKPNLYLAANNFASFMDVDDAGETAPSFDCADCSKQEKASLDLGNHSFTQVPALMNDNADGMSPFQLKGSPGASSVATEEHYTSAPGSLSWPTYKLPSQWSTQHQETWPGEFNWANMPLFQNGAHNSRLANADLDSPMSMNDNISGLPLINEMHNPGSAFASSACKHDFNFASAVNPTSEYFGVPDINAMDNENVYPLDHSTYSESQPSVEPDGSEFQERRDFQTIAYHSDTRNAFLIECKRRGLSYKDIKRIGGFKEAESTLRGRFRTLTKSKEQRVRKPQWQPRDVSYQ